MKKIDLSSGLIPPFHPFRHAAALAWALLACVHSIALADNPIIPNQGVCDPHIRIYNNKAYLYSSHDYGKGQPIYRMDDWQLFSSTDLVSWQKKFVLRPQDTYIGPWTTCYAPDGIERNGNYYFYFSQAQSQTGVAVSTSGPDGPYVDALGAPMLPQNLTPSAEYDPSIFIDDDPARTPYIIWGFTVSNQDYYIARLNENMISRAEAPRKIVINNGWKNDAPFVHKRNGIYYLSSHGSVYATATNVYGPYTYRGTFSSDALVDHGGFFNWNNQNFFAYGVPNNWGENNVDYFYRTTKISYIHYKDNGEIVNEPFIEHSPLGVAQYDAWWGRTEAEWFFAASDGISKREGASRFEVQGLAAGSALSYPKFRNLPANATLRLRLSSASATGGTIEVREGSATGPLLGSCSIPATGNWSSFQTVVCPLVNTAGQKDLCLVFSGGGGQELARLDWLSFRNPENEGIVDNWTAPGEQGLHGWYNFRKDTSSYTAINPYQFTENVAGGLLSAPVGGLLQMAGENTAPDQDAPHATLVAESPSFTIGSSEGKVREITFTLEGGAAGGALVNNYKLLPASSAGTSGFVGLALKRVVGGAYLLSQGLATNNTSASHTWNAAALAAATAGDPENATYTLQLIDYKHGAWGYVGLQSVTLSLVGAAPPAISLLSPRNDATGVPINANLSATFTEPVIAGTGRIELWKTGGVTPLESFNVATSSRITFSGSMLTIDPTANLAFSNQYHVRIDATAIKDGDNENFAGITDPTGWTFSTGPSSGLIGWWDFNDGNAASGPGGIKDLATSGGSHDATLAGTGGTFSSDVPAVLAGTGSRSLDLTAGGYAIVDSFTGGAANADLNPGGALSVSFWVKGFPSGTTEPNVWNPFVSRNGESAGWQVRRLGTGNTLTFTLRGTSAADDPTGPTIGPNPGWTHIVATYDGSRRKLFVNGSASLDISDTGSITSTSELVHFGSGAAGFRRSAVKLDDIGIWNTALSQQEITDLVNGISPVVPPSDTFSSWIAGYEVGTQTGLGDDPDRDGIDNGVENFFGTAPSVFSQGMVAGVVTGSQFTFTHPQGTLAGDLTAAYLWSTDLLTFHGHGAVVGGTTITFAAASDTPAPGISTVTATVTGNPVPKFFVKIAVTGE